MVKLLYGIDYESLRHKVFDWIEKNKSPHYEFMVSYHKIKDCQNYNYKAIITYGLGGINGGKW